jgi:hypothetical protein
MEAKDVDLNELRGVIKELNAVGELSFKKGKETVTHEIVKIKVIGKKKEDLLKQFAEIVETTPDEVANELPENVIIFYNKVFNEEEAGAEPEKKEDPDPPVAEKKKPTPKTKGKKEEPEKEEEPEKKEEEPPKKKKEKKAPVKKNLEKDEFGYVVGTGANLIDRAIIDSGKKGVTKAEMVEASGRTVGSHIYALKAKGIVLTIADGRYSYSKGKK